MALFNKDKKASQEDAEDAMEAAQQKRKILQNIRQTEIYAQLILARAKEMREVLEHGARSG